MSAIEFHTRARSAFRVPFLLMLLVTLFSCFLDDVWARSAGDSGGHHNQNVLKPMEEEGGDEGMEDEHGRVEETKTDEKLEDEEAGDDGTHGCHGCNERRRIMQERLKAEEIRQLHIEEIKKQILKKLRLKAPPNVTIPVSMLPGPLTVDDNTDRGAYEDEDAAELDDYYGRTERIIIFPTQTNGYKCTPRTKYPSMCLHFLLGPHALEGNIVAAELLLYKVREKKPFHNETLSVTDLHINQHSRHHHHKKNRTIEAEAKLKSGWIRLDVKHLIKRWLHHQRNSLNGLEVGCLHCHSGVELVPTSIEGKHRPFLLLKTDESNFRSRSKRSTNCANGITECCREQLFVSFNEIGWDSWIVQPSGYMANYCKGSCIEEGSITTGSSPYTAVLQRMSQQKLNLLPCCTPKRMSSISLLYMDDDEKIYLKRIPNMVVESCGCL